MERLARLQADAGGYQLFAALRLLECAHPSHARIGTSASPQDDPVRLGQTASLAFSPSMLSAVRIGAGGAAEVDVACFGLMGANGPLPQHLSEYVRDRLRNAGDPTLARFLDLFHHRMIGLFYRAWASAQPTVNLDREHGDRFAVYLGSLIGMGIAPLRGRGAVPDQAKLHHAGRLAAHNRSAGGLAALLAEYFRVPVRIEQFVGHWIRMPDDSRCHLGGGGVAARLGNGTVLGSKVWNCQHKFRIVFGPLNMDDYLRLMPATPGCERLRDWVRHYAGLALDWDVSVHLKREAVPALALGRARLGWTGWLLSSAAQRDAQAIFYPNCGPAVQTNRERTMS
jgi:type VI secretion system protein ImpH